MQPIAIIETPFPDKFSIPRQPGLAPAATGRVRLVGDYQHAESIEGIEHYSHLWLLFEFNQHRGCAWRERVRPPRLGGNKRMGVFATRSPFRPNHIGLSVVKLLEVIKTPVTELIVSGVDLLNQTPIFDIKPYIPYADCVIDARSGLAQQQPPTLEVQFTERANNATTQLNRDYPNLRQIIMEVLAQDPRPAYHKLKQPQKSYVSGLFDLELVWQVTESCLQVTEIRRRKDF